MAAGSNFLRAYFSSSKSSRYPLESNPEEQSSTQDPGESSSSDSSDERGGAGPLRKQPRRN